MGFIERTAGITSFSKAVISIWFRIPQASIDAAIAQYEAIPITTGSLTDANLPGVIPLLTFGVPATITGAVPTESSRCFIGVHCGHIEPSDLVDELPLPSPRMFAYLQYDSGDVDIEVGGGISAHDYFNMGGILGGAWSSPPNLNDGEDRDGQFITVSADAWHHILVSFDMSGGCSMTSTGDGQAHFNGDACQFFWAFDDVDYHTDYLWPSNPNNYSGETGGANDIVSQGVRLAGSYEDNGVTRSFAAGDLPVSGNPIGIPASTDDASHNYNQMQAELQIFTDVTLDTSVEINRRLFVTEDGRPASPSLPVAYFGKDPEIYFPTHTDWISGNNHGTAGDFTPTGTITQYTPGP